MEKVLRFFKRRIVNTKIRVTTLLAALIALIVCIEVWGWLEKPEPSFKNARYLVTKRELSKGLPITFVDLGTRSDLSLQESEGALTDQELHLIKGSILKRDLTAGATISLDDLVLSPKVAGLGSAIPAGHRAYLVESAQADHLKFGDVVDISITMAESDNIPLTLAEKVLVIDSSSRSHAGGEVLVALEQSEIDILEKYRGEGRVNIALRNPSDNSRGEFRRPKPKMKGVEVWAE